MADYLSGLLGGFLDRKREIEEQNLYEGIRSREREASILQTLIQSPDPETRNLAIAGLLESAAPAKRKSGLKGWIGQLEASPYLERIRSLSPTVQQPTALPDAPTQQGFLPTPPPAAGGAAQPATSPTVRGADGAPLSPVQPMPNVGVDSGTEVARFRSGVEAPAPLVEPPPQVGLGLDARGVGAPPPNTLSLTQPRQVMPTTADLARQQARAKAMGDVEGDVAGLVASGVPEPQARAAKLQQMQGKFGLGPSTNRPMAVEYYEPDQDRWITDIATYDTRAARWIRSDGQPIVGRVRPAPRNTDLGDPVEIGAKLAGYASSAEVPLEEFPRVMALARTQLEQQAYFRGRGAGQARYETPIGPSVAQQTGFPIGTRGPDVAGQQVAPQAVNTQRRALENAVAQIRSGILPKLAVLPSQSDFGGTVAPGAVLTSRRYMPEWQPKIAELESAISLVQGNLARALGERGNMTEQDIERTTRALVLLNTGWSNFFGGDNQETAAARLQEALTGLELVLQNLPQPPGVGNAPPEVAPRTPRSGTKTFKDANGVWQITLP